MQQASQRACGHPQHPSLCSQGPAPRQLLTQPRPAVRATDTCGRRCSQPAAALASDPDAGDERVQDNLVDMIHVQIGQQHVKSYFEDESDRLRRTAEEVKFFKRGCRPAWLSHATASSSQHHSRSYTSFQDAFSSCVQSRAHSCPPGRLMLVGRVSLGVWQWGQPIEIDVSVAQAKEEVDKMAQLEMDRSTLAFGSAMVRTVPLVGRIHLLPNNLDVLPLTAPVTHRLVEPQWMQVLVIIMRTSAAGGHQPDGGRV